MYLASFLRQANRAFFWKTLICIVLQLLGLPLSVLSVLYGYFLVGDSCMFHNLLNPHELIVREAGTHRQNRQSCTANLSKTGRMNSQTGRMSSQPGRMNSQTGRVNPQAHKFTQIRFSHFDTQSNREQLRTAAAPRARRAHWEECCGRASDVRASRACVCVVCVCVCVCVCMCLCACVCVSLGHRRVLRIMGFADGGFLEF